MSVEDSTAVEEKRDAAACGVGAGPLGGMSPSQRQFLALGAISALVAVAAGAFGAHGLEGHLSGRRLANWNTAAQYQMYHALGLLAVACLKGFIRCGRLTASGWLFVAGTVLFSGSLYVLALTGQTWLGAVTPFGGASFIAGWLMLAIAAIRRRGSNAE